MTTPTTRTKAKGANAAPPQMNRLNTTIQVSPEVMIVRLSVWLIEAFTTSTRLSVFFLAIFSRMRSNTTTVSLTE